MALPKQVQAQLAEVEELEKQLKAQGDEAPEEQEAEDTQVEVTEEPAKQEAKLEEVKPTDESPKEDPADEFQQKYKTLKGKYDAEVPRLHQQIRELTDQMKALKEAQDAAKKAEAEKPKERVSLVTDADREEFGDELLDVQRRIATEVAQEYEDRFEKQEELIKALQDQLQNTGSQIGEMNFGQKLRQLVPDFDQVDADERWMEWLNEYEPMLNGPRRDIAQNAFNTGDAETVAHYVKLFKQSLSEAPEPVKDTRQAELEKQVSPSRSVSMQKADQSKKVYSEREIAGAWTRIRNLNTKGQFDEASKLEAEITSAYLEGRVKA